MSEDVVTLHNAEGNAESQFVMEDGSPWDTSGVVLASAGKRGAAYILDAMVIHFIFAFLTRGYSVMMMWNLGYLWTSTWYVIPLAWMGFAGLKNEKDRASVILYLNQNSDSPKELP